MSITEQVTRLKTDFDEVYDAGKQAQYDAFWDAIQTGGNKTNYTYCFNGKYWTNELFNPKYPFIQTNCIFTGAFAASAITDLSEHTFIGISFQNAFGGSAIQKIGTVRVNTSSAVLTGIFSNCRNLHTIGSFELYPTGNTNTLSFSNAFASCGELREIRITGVISNDISFASSNKLTHDSLMSIINALYGGTNKKLTLGSTNLAKLTDAEKAIATEKGWTLA